MSAKRKDGGPAFPMGYRPEGNSANHPGMTLRDYFAAATLQVLVTCHSIDADTREEFAEEAYKLADAMISERAKAKGGAS
jgi:hypothetical protein